MLKLSVLALCLAATSEVIKLSVGLSGCYYLGNEVVSVGPVSGCYY